MGRFANEASISQGIILRLLSELSWPTFDTSVVWPEYVLEGRRVDFALCHPPGKPLVFIEVKQVGQQVDAERQLFEYAFHRGVPLAILTTGQEWHFFLPGERGDYGERRAYKLDLLERNTGESIARLHRYLDYDAVCSGQALEAARTDYRSVANEREARRTLPEAWQKLVEEGDELLLELLADKVESLCGFRPKPDTVADYLSNIVGASPLPLRRPTAPRHAVPDPERTTGNQPAYPDAGTKVLIGPGFVLRGKQYPARSARDVSVQAFQKFTELDASFPERFATRTSQRKVRRYLARSREDLYPGSKHLATAPSHTRELAPGSGWWIDVNLNRRSIDRVLTMACEVAGLQIGRDLSFQLE
jgi:hypothetical protein